MVPELESNRIRNERSRVEADIRHSFTLIQNSYKSQNINQIIMQLESTSMRLLKTINEMLQQLKTLRNNLKQNPDALKERIRENLIEMISKKAGEVYNLKESIIHLLTEVINFIRTTMMKIASTFDNLSKLTNRKVMESILNIQDALMQEKESLSSLRTYLIDIIGMYYGKFTRNHNSDYAINIESECRLETVFTSLGMICDIIEIHFKNSGTKTRSVLARTMISTNYLMQEI